MIEREEAELSLSRQCRLLEASRSSLYYRSWAKKDPAAAATSVLEMAALVCRLPAAPIGGNDKRYLASPTNTRERHRLNLHL